jgi:hypothetical protein
MILDWEEFSEDAVEVAKELRKEVELDAMKAKVAEAVRLARKPIFIQTNTRAKFQIGVCSVPSQGCCQDTRRMVPAMIDYIKDHLPWEPVLTKRGAEWGIKVVGGESPI